MVALQIVFARCLRSALGATSLSTRNDDPQGRNHSETMARGD